MNRLGQLAILALLLAFSNAFAQEKNITIIEKDDVEDDMNFFAFMPEVPTPPDFDEFGMGPGFMMGYQNCMNEPDPMFAPDDLNLTKEQLDKIKKIRSSSQKSNIPLRSDIQLKQIELKDLMDADAPDKSAVAAKVKEIDALKTQIKLNRMNARIDCRNVLTKEQKEKMEQMRGKHRMMFFDGGKKKFKFHRKMRDE